MELTEQRLTSVMRQNGEIFMKGIEKLHESRSEEATRELNEQSNAFKAFNKNMATVAKNIFSASSRENSISTSKQLGMMKKNIETSEKLSSDEIKALQKMHIELQDVNKSLLSNEHSLKSAMTESLKDSLPSIAGVLGAVGLDNPLMLFVGTFLQGVFDKAKDASKAQTDLMQENQLENITQELKQAEEVNSELEEQTDQLKYIGGLMQSEEVNSELEEQTDQLNYIGGLMGSMVEGSQAQKFEAIEQQRESIRMQEDMIDAIEGIGDGEDVKDKKDPFNISGIMETIGGISMLVTSMIPFLGGLLAFLAPIAGTIAVVYTIFEGFSGAVDGWNNAADKLGKDSATTSDKIASAIGGFYGGVWGIVDKITGFFGWETDLGGWVDQAVTENIAAGFDFVKDLAANITRIFTETKEYITSTFNNIIATGKQIIDDFKNSVMANFNLLKDKLFNFEMPDIPTIKDMVGDGVEKMIAVIGEIIKGIAESLKDFSLTDLVFGEKEIVKPEEIKKGDVFSTLKSEGAIKDVYGPGKGDTIEDIDRLKQLSQEQLQELIMESDWKRNDLAMLQSLKTPTVSEITGNQPRALAKDQASQTMLKDGIERQKASSAQIGNIVSSPNNSSTTTTQSTTNLSTSNISPRETDWSLRALKAKFGF